MATMIKEPKTIRGAEPSHDEGMAPVALSPLLVATDGSEAADDALRAARAIAARTGQQVELLAVYEPLPMVAPEIAFAEGPELQEERRSALHARVMEQVARTKSDIRWPLEVVIGQPEAQIANAAQRIGASLVIMGLGEHGLYERILGDEMVLRVIRLGTVPVLAVAPGFLGLPKRVLAATDFSPSSARAAKLAESISSPRAKITMAHVLVGEIDAAKWNRTNAAFHGTIGRDFDVLAAKLSEGVVTDRTLLAGDAAKSLLEHARLEQMDLIATGSHGFGFLTRLWLGSVSQRLVRGARCSVLVVPPADAPNYVDELPTVTNRFAAYEWAERLEEFTRRNKGRMVTMEIIDPDLGAQIENRGMPLLGVDFDARDASIHVMLGEDDIEGRHLTRAVYGASAVQVLRAPDGRDLMLRVAHGRGQTLVTLERKT